MKKMVFLFSFLVFCTVLCYSQNIKGNWERDLYGGKDTLSFSENTLIRTIIASNGIKMSSPAAEYFASNGLLRFFDRGTGIYYEPARFEYKINGNTLVLIALNPNAEVMQIEGRYSRRR